MKRITSLLLIAGFIGCGFSTIQAQEYTHDVKQAKQVFVKSFIGEVTIEEHSGSQLVITVDDFEGRPERAEGLKSLYNNGASDNTEIGLQVTDNAGVIEIIAASKQAEDSKYIVKVPKGMNVKVDYSSPYAHDDIHVKNFSGELEAKALNPDIKLENVTGPLVLNMTNGDIEVEFNTINQSSPISIEATNGIIDITIPANTPANIVMKTINGELFTNFDIDFEKKETKNGLRYIGGGQNIDGKINGGGVKVYLRTINDNIYLRKK